MEHVSLKKVFNRLKDKDKSLIQTADDFLKIVLLIGPLYFGPIALPILSLFTVKRELIDMGERLLGRLKPSGRQTFAGKSENLTMAYCLLHYTSFFEALEITNEKIMVDLGLVEEEFKKYFGGVKAGYKAAIPVKDLNPDDLDESLVTKTILFPDPIKGIDFKSRELSYIHGEMTNGVEALFKNLLIWDRLPEEDHRIILNHLSQLKQNAENSFENQLILLAADFPEIYMLFDYQSKKSVLKRLSSQEKIVQDIINVSEQIQRNIDIGFNSVEDLINNLPERVESQCIHQMYIGLKNKYHANIDKPIVDTDLSLQLSEFRSLSFPNKSEIFIPQTYKVLSYDDRMKSLEDKETWERIPESNNLGFFIFRFLQSPQSIRHSLIVLGHPGSGKSLLTEILAAKLSGSSNCVVRIEMRGINPESEIHEQIEEQLFKDTAEEVKWSKFTRQFRTRPPILIFDGYDEILQTQGKLYLSYLKRIETFQQNEADLGRPVQILLTSRITLIDKTDVPIGSTIIKLMDFSPAQQNCWISIWNKKNKSYFKNGAINPFVLPDNREIDMMARQPLLLLLLAIYDSEDNKVHRSKEMNQTVLYHNIIRRFISRQLQKLGDYKNKSNNLHSDYENSQIELEFKRLGVAALAMFNRNRLYINNEELNSDLTFFNLERLVNEDMANVDQSNLLLGGFFFIHKSISKIRGNLPGTFVQKTSFEFLHNTFGEYLCADFITNKIIEEVNLIQSLDTLRAGKSLTSNNRFTKMPHDWYASLMFFPLHTKPNILRMMTEWISHRLEAEGIEKEIFLSDFDKILYQELRNILLDQQKIELINNQQPYPVKGISVLGHIAIYSLNLIIIRTILTQNEFLFDEGKLQTFAENTKPWERLTYLWRSWFLLENLHSLKHIMFAKRKEGIIYIQRETQFLSLYGESPPASDKASELMIEAATALGHDNIPSGLNSLLVHAALGISMDVDLVNKFQAQISSTQKMEAIGTLASGIAHDFNNILTPILGYTELILEDLPDEIDRIREMLKQIIKAATRAKDLVRQILTFSRRTEPIVSPVKPQEIIKEVMMLLRASLPSTIEFKSNISQDCRPILIAPTQLHQLVMNLATNAYHAMEQSGGTLTITLKEVDLTENHSSKADFKPGVYILLRVADTGVGIEPENSSRIFDPYFTTKAPGQGTGLGLSLVHGIVRESGGSIDLESSPGNGTRFDIYFPVTQELSKSKEQFSTSGIKGDEHILIVDDEKLILEFEKYLLERLGYKVTAFQHSREALEAVKNKTERFDMVIANVTMPDIRGDQLIKRLSTIDPNLLSVLCTGFNNNMTEEQLKSIGAMALFLKPINPDYFAKKIREILEEKTFIGIESI